MEVALGWRETLVSLEQGNLLLSSGVSLLAPSEAGCGILLPDFRQVCGREQENANSYVFWLLFSKFHALGKFSRILV